MGKGRSANMRHPEHGAVRSHQRHCTTARTTDIGGNGPCAIALADVLLCRESATHPSGLGAPTEHPVRSATERPLRMT
jgi:hypothetical protein